LDLVKLIEKKKRKQELTQNEIKELIEGFTSGVVPDYQMSAFLMATWFNGMTEDEITALTASMIASGEELDTSPLGEFSADKHSTGGVGDNVSLLLAPLAAACGLKVPMLSGRGLGHTGGTLDKLEAIPGYRIDMSNEEFLDITNRVGCAIIGQNKDIAPADGKIYAMRDVTGTVDCVPLITASIMSKKLAAGPKTIVIDLKVGSGAFMTSIDAARELAESIVRVGRLWGRNMSVTFSDMSQPLGVAVGHANETIEAFEALRPEGLENAPRDLVDLTIDLVVSMLTTSGKCANTQEAEKLVRDVWSQGKAFSKMIEWVEAQGGQIDPSRPDFGLVVAPELFVVKAEQAGFVQKIDCRAIGLSLRPLNGARSSVDDKLDLSTGVEFLVAIGQELAVGQDIAIIKGYDETAGQQVASMIQNAVEISADAAGSQDLIIDKI
jgi:pyrimidine-nucleoside phosphorylase